MIDPSIFLGLPLKFGETCTIYPPKVKDVVSNPKIMQLYKLLTYSQEDIEDLLASLKNKEHNESKRIPTPLEFILINAYQNKEFASLIIEARIKF